ncbi:MAG: hypothetical protein FWC56_00220 [Phycisphaerae bacterium]|nr:hypothetical protein [Phycisphaerae bacterium]
MGDDVKQAFVGQISVAPASVPVSLVGHVIASAAKQSSLISAGLPAELFSGLFYLDCFAALAMTGRGLPHKGASAPAFRINYAFFMAGK